MMVHLILRTTILYALLILVIRLMGKRQIGQMEPAEFVVTMLVANLAAVPMENLERPLRTGVVPILTVLVLEAILAIVSLRSIWARKVLCGKPVILIENGRICQENLRKNRVTLDELTGHLRQKDVLDLSSVQYAILETNGNLSVFPYPKERPATAKEAGIRAGKQFLPLTVVSDGRVIPDNLKLAGKDGAWLERVLAQRHTTLADTYLLTVDAGDKILFYPREN